MPNESPKHKRLVNKVYVPPYGCCNRKKIPEWTCNVGNHENSNFI